MSEQDQNTVEHPLKGKFDLSRAEWEAPGEGDVQIAFVDDLIGMRNGADPGGPILVFTEAEWEAFVAGAKDGEFDPDTFDSFDAYDPAQNPERAGDDARAAQERELEEEGE